MFEFLRWACIAVFTAGVPVLLLTRRRYPECPLWLLLVAATALGWLLACAYAQMFYPMHREFEFQYWLDCHVAERHPVPPPAQGSGDTAIDNPCGLGDYLPEIYQPLGSLLYGPVYFLACALVAWLWVYRTAPTSRKTVGIAAGGVLLAAVGVLYATRMRLEAHPIESPSFLEASLMYGWHYPFFGPQLVLPLILILGWILVVGIPRLGLAVLGGRPAK